MKKNSISILFIVLNLLAFIFAVYAVWGLFVSFDEVSFALEMRTASFKNDSFDIVSMFMEYLRFLMYSVVLFTLGQIIIKKPHGTVLPLSPVLPEPETDSQPFEIGEANKEELSEFFEEDNKNNKKR